MEKAGRKDMGYSVLGARAGFWMDCAGVGLGGPSAALRAGDARAHLGCSSRHIRISRLLLDMLMKIFYG